MRYSLQCCRPSCCRPSRSHVWDVFANHSGRSGLGFPRSTRTLVRRNPRREAAGPLLHCAERRELLNKKTLPTL